MIFYRQSIGLISLAILSLFFILMPGEAKAACSTSSGSGSFGTVSSFTAAASAQTAESSTGFKCTGSVLSLISTNTITATITSATNSQGTQPRLHNAASGDYIPYIICQTASCASTYSVGSQITWSRTTFAGILGLFNASDGSLPIYIRTIPGTHVAAGTYTSTVIFNWTWSLCSVGALGVCVYENGSGTSTVSITMNVGADCILSAPPVNFGSAAFVQSFDPITQTLTIRCSKNAAYSVGINNGQNYSTHRRLRNGSSYISYEIFYPQGSTSRWGYQGAERRSSAEATTNASVYTGVTDQTYTYRAEILSGQPAVPSGTYTDMLTVDVQF